jgi:hypothetical protein
MRPLNLNEVRLFVEKNIGDFHARRLEKLQKLKLKQVLKRKNPYLLKKLVIFNSEAKQRG